MQAVARTCYAPCEDKRGFVIRDYQMFRCDSPVNYDLPLVLRCIAESEARRAHGETAGREVPDRPASWGKATLSNSCADFSALWSFGRCRFILGEGRASRRLSSASKVHPSSSLNSFRNRQRGCNPYAVLPLRCPICLDLPASVGSDVRSTDFKNFSANLRAGR